MHKRKWDAQTTAMIVIEGLKGKPVAELCTEHQIRQSLDDQWRDQLLAQAAKAFADPPRTRKEVRLQPENGRLKQLSGALTWELRKSDALLA